MTLPEIEAACELAEERGRRDGYIYGFAMGASVISGVVVFAGLAVYLLSRAGYL